MQMEYERSWKCSFEVRKEAEIREAELIRKGLTEMDFDKPIDKTAQDVEDASLKEFQEFTFAPRETGIFYFNCSITLKSILKEI